MVQIKNGSFLGFTHYRNLSKSDEKHISLYDDLKTHLKTDQIACFGGIVFSKHAPRRLPPRII